MKNLMIIKKLLSLTIVVLSVQSWAGKSCVVDCKCTGDKCFNLLDTHLLPSKSACNFSGIDKDYFNPEFLSGFSPIKNGIKEVQKQAMQAKGGSLKLITQPKNREIFLDCTRTDNADKSVVNCRVRKGDIGFDFLSLDISRTVTKAGCEESISLHGKYSALAYIRHGKDVLNNNIKRAFAERVDLLAQQVAIEQKAFAIANAAPKADPNDGVILSTKRKH